MPTLDLAAPRSVTDTSAPAPAVRSQSATDVGCACAAEPDVTWLEAEWPDCEVDCVHWLVS